MYRSFVPQSRQMLEEGEEAYAEQSVTEPSTTQMAALRANPWGSDSFAASLCCALGHIALHYAPSGAPRPAAKLLAAIGAATSSEVPILVVAARRLLQAIALSKCVVYNV